ncbi:nitrite reductase small subunit NirD [Nonomuraea jiangxiensis]|uniref:Nitrite reductase (NADH) small subunit n=1 Tax=Nonomuraea jiangxiensis TaxID=633440 RepID=A0A1G9U7Y2_9ACTN|nr:nitrite reductase small subunit NirD [Nonomuraea jiangxiensis]SDM55978.1 nitrite reductase (NADH) small subunit [Nonomuraea jiangxiensis]
MSRRTSWTQVCDYTVMLPERGVCALVDGVQVALFRTYDGGVHAVGNRDPFSGAYVLSRGIVGTRKDEPTVASPLHKQVFSLVSGVCLDEEAVSVPVYRVRVRDGRVEVSLSSLSGSQEAGSGTARGHTPLPLGG